MKFTNLIILVIAFSQISLNICGALSRNHRYRITRSRTSRRTGQAENKWYNLFTGIMMQFASLTPSDITSLNTCIPDNFKVKDAASTPADEAAQKSETSSVWTEVLNGVGKILDFVCKFKDNIKKLISSKLTKMLRRRKYRMFVSTSVSNRRVVGWWSDVTNTVSKTFKAVTGAVIDWSKKAWSDVSSFAGDVVNNLKNIYGQFMNTIKTIMDSGFVKMIENIYKCIQTAKGIGAKIVQAVSTSIKKVQAMIAAGAAPVVIAGYVVDYICKFEDFRNAINLLIQGIESKDTIKKYNLIGQFIGKLAKTILGRRRHH